MVRQQNTFAKRAREMDKRRKADEKLARRRQKKQLTDARDAGAGAAEPADPPIETNERPR